MISTGLPWASLINSVPGAPGRRRSLTIRSKPGILKRSCASCTEPASLTWYWLRSSRRRRAERIMVSSSTIKIWGINSVSRRSQVAGSIRYGRRFDMPRQRHPDTGAALVLGVNRAVDYYLSIMLFHDGIDQREAEPRAFAWVLGGEERFEQAVDDRLGNATAFIFHDQVDGVFRGFGSDADRGAGWRGIPGVGQQVDQHLGETLRVAVNPVIGVAQIEEFHFDAAPIE